jgi:outer membrane receptor for ferrienterochelin and colicin
LSSRFVTKAVSAAVLSSLSSVASAEDLTDAPQALPEVVVTATATPRALQTAPASVTVVDQRALSRRPVQDLTDVLRDVQWGRPDAAGDFHSRHAQRAHSVPG